MTKEEITAFCKSINITEKQFYGIKEIKGDLDLRNLTSIPEGFNPTVGGYLDLSSLTSIPEGFNPTVGGYLDLSSLTSIPEGFNPTVGGHLYLRNLTSIPEGFNPTVGGSLYLRNLTSIPEGFNPTVGGYLCLIGNTKRINNLPKDYLFSWENGKYILIDEIFCEVIYKKRNVFKCKRINKDKLFYIVTDSEGNFSHGNTIKEAKEDLIYKISNRDKSDYDTLNLDSILSYEEAIKCYRVITGACSFGTKDFCNNRLEKKEKYSIAEIISLTKNEFGNKLFTDYFCSKNRN